MSRKLAVVVTGGTGKQGGAVVKSLLERGHEVRAVTRSTESAKARELASAGVTLVRASLEDTAALTRALEGATSLFAMTTPFEGGTQAETRQGVSAANAAKAAGVHLVFTSAGSANRQTGIPHFDSKYEVEEHIAKIGVRATVLAPVYFMENLHFGKEQLAKGIYATPLPPTRQLAQVAVADIGGRRRSPPGEPRPLRRQALRPRGRRAHGQRRPRHPLACHRSPVRLFPGAAGRHPPTHG